jgi:hypothetical protein
MPVEGALDPGELDLLTVQLGGDVRVPEPLDPLEAGGDVEDPRRGG